MDRTKYNIEFTTIRMIRNASDEELTAWSELIETKIDEMDEELRIRTDEEEREAFEALIVKLMQVGSDIENEQFLRDDVNLFPTDIPRDELDYEHNQPLTY